MIERFLPIKVAMETDVGRERPRNEDSCCALLRRGRDAKGMRTLLAVADGMGGLPSGKAASEMAVEVMADHFAKWDEELGSEEALQAAVAEANKRIFSHHQKGRSKERMGTTLTVGAIKGNEVFIAHVGDSRAYLIRNGEIKLLVREHSWVAEEVREGRMTEEEAAVSTQRNMITRSVGLRPLVTTDLHHRKMEDGDLLLLCSDGLSAMVSDDEILAVALNTKNIHRTCQNLIHLANQRGGHDNITVVMAEIGKLDRKLAISRRVPTVPVYIKRLLRLRRWLKILTTALVLTLLLLLVWMVYKGILPLRIWRYFYPPKGS